MNTVTVSFVCHLANCLKLQADKIAKRVQEEAERKAQEEEEIRRKEEEKQRLESGGDSQENSQVVNSQMPSFAQEVPKS